MDETLIKRMIDDEIKKVVPVAFIRRKLTDTPTDDLQVTPRKYVNLSGTTAQRPKSSVATIGQQYFDTSVGYPQFYRGDTWVSATGSIVGVGV